VQVAAFDVGLLLQLPDRGSVEILIGMNEPTGQCRLAPEGLPARSINKTFSWPSRIVRMTRSTATLNVCGSTANSAGWLIAPFH
jgi:hypothetical protein